jgi:hypothetical protein
MLQAIPEKVFMKKIMFYFNALNANAQMRQKRVHA